MNHWFTLRDAPITQTWVKRFDPLHWNVDFPRGTIASLVTSGDGHGLTIEAEFLRQGDLVGLIYESEDSFAHPAHARATKRDYSQCVLSFRWQSSGLIALDQPNGPTLTIEGEDAAGVPRIWLVRLWNYASGSPTDAVVTLNFDALDGGYALPADADRVDPRFIDRMFISLVPPDYVEGSDQIRATPTAGSATLSATKCDGPGSVLPINDAVAPEHELRIATAYDDMYNLAPERIIQSVERLGYRGVINHYIGMSHYFALTGTAALLDPTRGLNGPALAWHRDFARAAKARGYEVIWSLSYEILAMFCPEEWKQRAFDGSPALTAWEPPSSLVSPANADAITFLSVVAEELAGIASEAELPPQIQIGEPWWWVKSGGAICLYDDATKAALGGSPVEIEDVAGALDSEQLALLDEAGALLAASTAQIATTAKLAGARTLLLVYLPSVLDPQAPEVRRANLPVGWARPAFDRLQIEDYDWVTAGRSGRRAAAYAAVDVRLGYATSEQQYLSGFVADAEDRAQWRLIIEAALEARVRGCADVFLWAWPQIVRDGLTIFGEEEEVAPFDDVTFPIEIGAEASVSPGFSTNIVTSASGYEFRNANWARARLRFDAGPGVRSDRELETLIAFFRARRGPAVGFRFRDPYDFSSNQMSSAPTAADQLIGHGDGVRVEFPLIRTYGTGEERRITRPVAGSVRVAMDGLEVVSGWTLQQLGILQFDDPPAAGVTITAGFQFDVPVRFAEDRIDVNRATFLAGEAPTVPLIEIREA